MNKLNWEIIVIIFGIIIGLIIIGFYVFISWKNYKLKEDKELYEMQIKQKCSKKANSKSENYNQLYQACLHENGL